MPDISSTDAVPDNLADARELTRALIIDLATKEFASKGFAGAKLEQIAADAGVTRAMIYYYFGGREGLYVAVLEDAYKGIWEAEGRVQIEGLAPARALQNLVEFRVDYYIEHPTFVAIVSIENQHQAAYLKRLKPVAASAEPSLARTRAVLSRGQADGVFRKDIDVVDLYQVIVSLAFFNVANRCTFGAIFKRDWTDAVHVRRLVVDTVMRFVSSTVS